MKYRLSDLAEVCSSKRIYAKEYRSSSIPFYRGKEIIAKSEGHKIANLLFISEDRYNTLLTKYGAPEENDILISAVGTIGKVYIVDRRDIPFYFKDGNLIRICNYNYSLIDPYYLYYLLKSSFGQNVIKKIEIGSTQKAITIKELSHIVLDIPSLQKQQEISAMFKKIDAQASVNRRLNDNLLELAKAKFTQTYELPTNEFQKIPNGWEYSKLDKIITFSNGHNFKSNEMLKVPESLTYKIFKQGNISIGGGLNDLGTKNWIQKNKVKNLDKYVLKKWDLLMAMTDMKNKVAILGNTALMNRDNQYILNQRVGLIRSNNYNNTSPYYLFLLTNSKPFLHRIRLKAHSGVQVNLS